MKQQLRIFGAGVRAQVVVDLIAWCFADQLEIEGFYDDRLAVGSSGPSGYPILGNVPYGLEQMPASNSTAFIALGTRASATGCEIFLALQERHVSVQSLIAPTAHISPSARIGQNALVMPGVFIGCDARIGHLFCAHGGAVIEHHCRIGHNVLLGPGVALASKVSIGSHAFLGAGATIIPEKTVGHGTFLGAGSLIIHDIPSGVIAFGRPAAPVRTPRPGDEIPLVAEVERLIGLGLA